MLSIDLTGQKTLVVGGARGIGAAIVDLAAEAGSSAAWTCLDGPEDKTASEALVKKIKNRGVDSLYYIVDCSDDKNTRAAVNDLAGKWGGIDNMVYCAGFTCPVSFLDLDIEEWRRAVDINLNGAFTAASSVIPFMKERGKGNIILIGSAAIAAGGGGRADYVSAKAGLEGLNRAITKEFAPCGIRCNIVHPSLIETDLLKQRYPDPGKRKQLAGEVPVGRLGRPEDIAYPTVFLLSDMASYITGQSLFVDGGRTFCKS